MYPNFNFIVKTNFLGKIIRGMFEYFYFAYNKNTL